MAKYLLILVCVLGIVGVAHAVDISPVVNLEITEDGHAYLVFTDGDSNPATQSNLAGYEIRDTRAAGGVTFERPGPVEDGTGQYASVWSSLTAQGPLAGEENPGTGPTPLENWFFDGTPTPTYFLGEGNIQGYMTRAPGTPIYIGRILNTDPDGLDGLLVPADFDTGGWINTNLTFKSSNDPDNVVAPGTITLRTPGALVAGETDLAGSPYMQTGDIGAVGTDFDASYVQSEAGDKVIIDLKVDVAGVAHPTKANTILTTFGTNDGHLMVNGKVMQIAYADLAEETSDGTPGGDFVSALLRIQAVDGDSTVAINANLTEDAAAPDALGRYGTLGSSMLVSLVPGDFDFNGHCDAADIDLISEHIRPGTGVDVGLRSLLYDVDHDGDVDGDDRFEVIGSLVEWSNSDPTLPDSGNGTALGDINLDGKVTAGDYTLWGQYFGQSSTWAKGDLNNDGTNTAGDYTLWGQFFGQGPDDPVTAPSGAPVPTPEPATMTLLAIGGLAFVSRRRRIN